MKKFLVVLMVVCFNVSLFSADKIVNVFGKWEVHEVDNGGQMLTFATIESYDRKILMTIVKLPNNKRTLLFSFTSDNNITYALKNSSSSIVIIKVGENPNVKTFAYDPRYGFILHNPEEILNQFSSDSEVAFLVGLLKLGAFRFDFNMKGFDEMIAEYPNFFSEK